MALSLKQLGIGKITNTTEIIIYNKQIPPDGFGVYVWFPLVGTILKNIVFCNEDSAPVVFTIYWTPANSTDALTGHEIISQDILLPASGVAVFDDEITFSRQTISSQPRGDLLSVKVTSPASPILTYVANGVERNT